MSALYNETHISVVVYKTNSIDIIGNKRKNQINQKEEKSCEKEL